VPRKTQEASANNVCPSCGARANAVRTSPTSIREIAVTVVCGSLLLAIAVPAAWATEQWLERQSHRVMDRMIWREPVESWNL